MADVLAAGWLLLVGAGLLTAAGVGMRRSPYPPVQTLFYVAAYLCTRLLWRAKPPAGFPFSSGMGGVVVCNHRSSIDPFFVQVCCDRPIHWMVAREYCEHPAFRWFLRRCEVIPVNRGGIDTQATKAAIRLAARGELIGMLPEGRINMSSEFMLPVRPGAVLVALKARVPILPCYIHNAPYGGTPWSPFFIPSRVRLVFGELIDLAEYYDRQDEEGLIGQLTLRVAREIARLANRDFQPRLAGRRWKPTAEELAEIARSTRARIRQSGQNRPRP